MGVQTENPMVGRLCVPPFLLFLEFLVGGETNARTAIGSDSAGGTVFTSAPPLGPDPPTNTLCTPFGTPHQALEKRRDVADGSLDDKPHDVEPPAYRSGRQ